MQTSSIFRLITQLSDILVDFFENGKFEKLINKNTKRTTLSLRSSVACTRLILEAIVELNNLQGASQ